MALKPGSVTNFTNSMAEAMEQAFKSEWLLVKDMPLPETGEADRKILFAAIAQGVLHYLEDHKTDIQTSKVKDTIDGHSHVLAIDVD
jgi:hypothetical protein